jgi:hypothetical protein
MKLRYPLALALVLASGASIAYPLGLVGFHLDGNNIICEYQDGIGRMPTVPISTFGDSK